jgi:hypothetical protein
MAAPVHTLSLQWWPATDIDWPRCVQNNHLNQTRQVNVRCWWLWKELQINSVSGVAMDKIEIQTPF